MDFMGIGVQELLLILVVLVIFVPPNKLPEIARGLGKVSRKLREATRELTQEFERMEGEVKEVGGEISRDVKPRSGLVESLREISGDFKGIKEDLRGSVKSLVIEKDKSKPEGSRVGVRKGSGRETKEEGSEENEGERHDEGPAVDVHDLEE